MKSGPEAVLRRIHHGDQCFEPSSLPPHHHIGLSIAVEVSRNDGPSGPYASFHSRTLNPEPVDRFSSVCRFSLFAAQRISATTSYRVKSDHVPTAEIENRSEHRRPAAPPNAKLPVQVPSPNLTRSIPLSQLNSRTGRKTFFCGPIVVLSYLPATVYLWPQSERDYCWIRLLPERRMIL
jgi:hypothetical protein